ncbi:hypothetical protein SDC9_157754 [bioreactor metagenome]|uniref:Uncharacterized protein n=1 Tax=bioreactor metagenome TaxID=1076179 RepID=A0A645FAU8_9ZZZZ
MPNLVVDGLKSVNIGHDDGEGQLFALRALNLALKRFLHIPTVKQTGQRVANGKLAQLLLVQQQLVSLGFDLLQLPVVGEPVQHADDGGKYNKGDQTRPVDRLQSRTRQNQDNQTGELNRRENQRRPLGQ